MGRNNCISEMAYFKVVIENRAAITRLMQNVEPPPGFIDRIPRRGPWSHPASIPCEFESVEILTADGRTDFAVWTGKLWWRMVELHPIGWRRMDGGGMSYQPTELQN